MTTVAILPEPTNTGDITYRAISAGQQSVGKTAGEALDTLTTLLPDDEIGTLIIIQHQRPDRFFTAKQQQRLGELMARWRAARDTGTSLSTEEQSELDALVELEVRAASERAKTLLEGISQ